MDAFATTVSVSLQYGVPLRDLVNKFAHVRFEPSGFTGNSEIPIAKSIVDYIFRWLGSRFMTEEEKSNLGLQGAPVAALGSALAPLPPASPAVAFGSAEAVGGPAPAPAPATDAPKIENIAISIPKPEAPTSSAGLADAPKPERVELGYLATVGAASNGHSNGHANGHSNGNATRNGGGITLNLGGTKVAFATQADAPSCMDCGSIMVRNGSCYKCLNCGSTSGCS
jgi:ribonucleoside-diphosphate reductase alpha chain